MVGCGIMAMLGAAIGIPIPMPIGAAAIGIIGAAIGIIGIMGAAIGIMPAAGATGMVIVISAGCGIATGRMIGIGMRMVSNMKPSRVFCFTWVVIWGIPWP
jgi:hypothetical protein